MLDTVELTAMQFSKNGVDGIITQEEDGRYKICFGNNGYIFEYEDFQLMKHAMDQFTIKKSVIDYDIINVDQETPF